MSVRVVPVGVPTWVKVVQVAPWQRSTRYPLTPTLSVDGFQARLIWPPAAGVAVNPDGVDGGVVSGVGVAAVAVLDAPLVLSDASTARTR